jgi:hypothetical protein
MAAKRRIKEHWRFQSVLPQRLTMTIFDAQFDATDPKHWRERAEEARARACEVNDPAAKRQMLGIARGYERLAERAEKRLPSPRGNPVVA